MPLAIDGSHPQPSDGVPLIELADMTGVHVKKLSALAISGSFPSLTLSGSRRIVDRKVAWALVVLISAGLDGSPVLRAVFADPAGVAAATAEVAYLLAPLTESEA